MPILDRNLHSTPRVGQILVDLRKYNADPESVLTEIRLKVKDFLDDDRSLIEIVVIDVKGRNL